MDSSDTDRGAVPQDGSSADRTALFHALIQPLLGTGYAVAFAMLRDRQAAEDAVQEAALKAWRAVANANRDGRPLRPWFLAIVGNQCRDTRRAGWWRVLRPGVQPKRPKRTTRTRSPTAWTPSGRWRSRAGSSAHPTTRYAGCGPR